MPYSKKLGTKLHKEINGKYGPVKFFLKDEYVGRSLYNYGEYGPDETDMILSLASGTCLDIGANIGCISQALLSAGHYVLAFEPQPAVYDVLDYNMRSVGGEYAAYNTAVGATAGMAKMPKVYYSAKGNFGGLGIGATSMYGSYEVPVITIDSLFLHDVGFMKIDVEGYEYEVLVGAKETIARCMPILYIEDDRSTKSFKLREYIRSLEYTIEEHKPTLYREENFFGLKKNIWDRNFASHNLICRPA